MAQNLGQPASLASLRREGPRPLSAMIRKLLIANRGEIACRVIRSAKRMGISTVAVYSDADARSLHVRMADEAWRVGPAPAAESYLHVEGIVEACRALGADGVHPGYGFLSENAGFAEALEAEGIHFVGPSADAIRLMGDKLAAKRLAASAGLNPVPGHDEAVGDAEGAVRVAREVGYPVMLKAAAGGGGKGMRVATSDEETRAGFERATREAQASFADPRIFIERFIEEPRHIEVQIIGDLHGNVVHLGERECSVQRRHQKVIEESPSVFIDETTREAMGAAACAVARAVGYHSAGTVEFIVDRDRNFYFLEMNTRLQVEHPVTELVTGLDLVRIMIEVAGGEALPLAQASLRLNGSAIEARVYAEDPELDFVPSSGRLIRFTPPAQGGGVRVDSGVVEGDEIPVFYDPMIAKVIAHGCDRRQAIERLSAALDALVVRGISHNGLFVSSVLAHPRFREGRLSTGFIEQEFAGGFDPSRMSEAAARRLRALAVVAHCRRERAVEPGLTREWCVVDGGEAHLLTLGVGSAGFRISETGDSELEVRTAWRPGLPLLEAEVDGCPVVVQMEILDTTTYRVSSAGSRRTLKVLSRRAGELVSHMPAKQVQDASSHIVSPMPGLLIDIGVREGDEVKAGQPVAVVEAMKMENVLRAPGDGVVARVLASSGETLRVGQTIIELGP